MANVLVVKRGCNCSLCSDGRVLARWKNTNIFNVELGESLYPLSILVEKNLDSIRRQINDNNVSHVILFINLGCEILPELATLDSMDIESVASGFADIFPNCDIYGILHQNLAETSSQEQYAVAHLKKVG